MQHAFLTAAAVVLSYMVVWFFIALRLRRNDLADIAWGGGFIAAAAASLAVSGSSSWRALFVTLLVVIWGARLMVHIGLRNRGRGEDARYRAWREEWGEHVVLRSFFQVFILQGLLLLVISVPVIRVNASAGSPLTLWDAAGAAVWTTGFLFEAVGDLQLLRFKKTPGHKGKFMTTGLWKYTRHPNYFGEVALWWGIYLIALSVPGGWKTVIGPLTITFLILKVSGIPLLEKKYEGNREFDQYKRKTSAFFPLPPKL